jgi:hypothetical protein
MMMTMLPTAQADPLRLDIVGLQQGALAGNGEVLAA